MVDDGNSPHTHAAASAPDTEADIAQLLTRGLAHHHEGRYVNAEECYRQVLQRVPDNPDALHFIGVIALQVGKPEIAVDYISRALTVRDDMADAHCNLANAYRELGDTELATCAYRRAIAHQPDNVGAYINMGITYESSGRAADAAECYRQAVALQPNLAAPHFNLGNVLVELGQLDEAGTCFQSALQCEPGMIAAHVNLGNVYLSRGAFDKAVESYRLALAVDPSMADVQSNLGYALARLEKSEEAEAALLEAIRLDPAYAEAHMNLGNLRRQQGRPNDAVDNYLTAISLKPDYSDAHNNLGSTLKTLGLYAEAIDSYRKAVESQPDSSIAHSNLLHLCSQLDNVTPAEVLDASREFGLRYDQPGHQQRTYRNSPDPSKALNVGFVSGDFGNHPVGHMILDVLAALGSADVQLFAYETQARFDPIHESFKTHIPNWRSIQFMSDEQACELIVDDGIDVLVDLSGHTAANRLPMFGRRPAPVQVTWLGYFATTGMTSIDYVLCDDWNLPKEHEEQFTEAPWRLPEGYICLSPPEGDVDVAPLPASSIRHLTFASFNKLTKLNDGVLSTWASVLHNVEDSRLFLKTPLLDVSENREQTLKRLEGFGVPRERVFLEGRGSREAMLASYGRADIALDPFPYCGGMTTLEAMWMGCPVVSLAGDRFVSRVGASVLGASGCPEWIAETKDAYIEIAVELARDTDRLAATRRALRGKIGASPICDHDRFAEQLRQAFRGMWQTWCERQASGS